MSLCYQAPLMLPKVAHRICFPVTVGMYSRWNNLQSAQVKTFQDEAYIHQNLIGFMDQFHAHADTTLLVCQPGKFYFNTVIPYRDYGPLINKLTHGRFNRCVVLTTTYESDIKTPLEIVLNPTPDESYYRTSTGIHYFKDVNAKNQQ